MAILYVSAEASELKPFANRLAGLRKLKWPIDYAYEGLLDGKRVLLAANGAGRRLASSAVEVALRAITAADLSASRLESIVSVGFCGALDPALKECAIVLGNGILDEASNESMACVLPANLPDGVVTGQLVSADRIVVTVAEKLRLRATGAIAVDMEAAGLASRARRAGLPLYCIKVVSDRSDESFAFDLNQMRSSEGRIARGKIVFYALKHPSLLPHLFRLKGRAERAAEVLGEFLVSCRIQSESDRAVVA